MGETLSPKDLIELLGDELKSVFAFSEELLSFLITMGELRDSWACAFAANNPRHKAVRRIEFSIGVFYFFES